MTTQMVDKSNFDNKQYKADLQCAYDCGYVKGQVDILKKIKAEFEEIQLPRDNPYNNRTEYSVSMEELEKREASNSDIAQWLVVEEYVEDDILKQEFQCTHCGFTHTFFDGHTTQYKYCPSCGKRMKFIKMPDTGFTLYPN